MFGIVLDLDNIHKFSNDRKIIVFQTAENFGVYEVINTIVNNFVKKVVKSG